MRGYVRCADYQWKHLFEGAEVISEGAVRRDAEGATYFGSTHIRLSDTTHPIQTAELDTRTFRQLIHVDPHARLRAMRIACLEAQIRSQSQFASVRTEITFVEESHAIRISVDIEAKLSRYQDRAGSAGMLHRRRS